MGKASAVLQLALLCSVNALSQSSPQAFSAEIVSLERDGSPLAGTARLYAAGRKARIEMAGSDGFFISDADAGTTLVVQPAQHLYLDARQSTPLTQIFVRVDPHDPCRQWQVAAATAGAPNTRDWRCEPMERAIVKQREIIEYKVATPDRQTNYAWVDATLDFPVKWQASDGKVFLVENILFEAQPASLFSIPSDYRKLDPQALLERIKRSDVWAEPPR